MIACFFISAATTSSTVEPRAGRRAAASDQRLNPAARATRYRGRLLVDAALARTCFIGGTVIPIFMVKDITNMMTSAEPDLFQT
ncbi:MAG: hypothetical protein L0Z50_33545, partial [Verrucomicrobiales bacterium]|nr:hypothetical protein [Verrucomicrobiales bacterium]